MENKETILCKEGYLIPKNKKYHDQIIEAKKELLVSPYMPYSFGMQKKPVPFPVYQENNEFLCVPKFYGLQKFGKANDNKEIDGEFIKIKFKGKLRPLQEEIVSKILPILKEKNGGVLCLPCAAGKTVLALYLASIFKVKTLVMVHKTFLLNQWKERAEEFTDAKVGIIQQDVIDTDGKDIVIGMLQSIAKEKYDDDIFRDFGLVIFDEAHHAPSEYFSKALPLIASKITLGLSATPKRADRLEKILYWYFGDILYSAEVQKNDRVIVNIINYDLEHEKFKEYKMRGSKTKEDINRPKTINKITSIGRRNKFIIDTMCTLLEKEPKRKIIVLSDRIEHLEMLKKRLDHREITTTDFYVGGMKQKLLKIAETKQVIFASYGMASEALDIPDLNTLFMVTPRKEVEQAVGRILRKIDPNIRPTIYDFTDQLPSFVNQGYQRRRLYKKMGFEINIIRVKNNEILEKENIININDISNIKCSNDSSDDENNDKCDFID